MVAHQPFPKPVGSAAPGVGLIVVSSLLSKHKMTDIFDIRSGSINIDSVRVSPRWSTQDFEASRLWAKGEVMSFNGNEITYRLKNILLEKASFTLLFIFSSERLASVQLSMQIANLQRSWETWSKDSEDKRTLIHDEFLIHNIGLTSGTFFWRNIDSNYDPRSGSSAILLNYT